MSRNFVGREIADVLNASGLDWRIEHGSKHTKVVVGDKIVTTLPRSKRALNATPRDLKNTIATIRRFTAGQQGA